MRIVHKNVIDTSVIFSSKSNTKLSLRLLTLTYLKRMIQGDNEDAVGHDSYEDAVACVDLIYFALKNPENVSKLKAIEMWTVKIHICIFFFDNCTPITEFRSSLLIKFSVYSTFFTFLPI